MLCDAFEKSLQGIAGTPDTYFLVVTSSAIIEKKEAIMRKNKNKPETVDTASVTETEEIKVPKRKKRKPD